MVENKSIDPEIEYTNTVNRGEKRKTDSITENSQPLNSSVESNLDKKAKIENSKEKPEDNIEILIEKVDEPNITGTTSEKDIINSNTLASSFDFDEWLQNPKPVIPSYYIENGLRKVRPYYYVYESSAKGRWFGRTILDVFVSEFQDQPPSYYKTAIENGRIRINKKIIKTESKIKNGDIIQHLIHRHEPPVAAYPEISFVYKSDQLIVVNKPSGMPVHPSGRYRFNTLQHILANEHGITKFFPANRLDRLTSGIVLIAQRTKVAAELEDTMKSGLLKKSYYCRVIGEFPIGNILCEEPIKTFSHKLGLNKVDKDGKAASTLFERVSFNGETSLVKCFPQTGRTHQIRVHLLHLGFPIFNDPLYKLSNFDSENAEKGYDMDKISDEKSKRAIEESTGGPGWTQCSTCLSYLPPDPSETEQSMWLHAFQYKCPDWDYITEELPSWTQN